MVSLHCIFAFAAYSYRRPACIGDELPQLYLLAALDLLPVSDSLKHLGLNWGSPPESPIYEAKSVG